MKGLAKAEEEPTFVFFSSALRANTTTLPGCAFLQSQAWLLAVPEKGLATPLPARLLPMPSSWSGAEAREGSHGVRGSNSAGSPQESREAGTRVSLKGTQSNQRPY